VDSEMGAQSKKEKEKDSYKASGAKEQTRVEDFGKR
jgi:hypothetical protein